MKNRITNIYVVSDDGKWKFNVGLTKARPTKKEDELLKKKCTYLGKYIDKINKELAEL